MDASAVANIATVTNLLLAAGAQVAKIGGLLSQAISEGRDVTVAELDALLADDAAARQGLVDAIAAGKAAGG